MTAKNQSEGREQNAAQPIGERSGLVSEAGIARTAEKEQKSAGPDGPDARETTKALKRPD